MTKKQQKTWEELTGCIDVRIAKNHKGKYYLELKIEDIYAEHKCYFGEFDRPEFAKTFLNDMFASALARSTQK